MTTKVKGLIKGLRYISQIFDEEKEAEIQIGFPTDVKHVAHIGWDGHGPSAVDNPTWMKEFKGAGALKSAPLGPPADSKDNPEIKWVSEDSKGRGARTGSRDAAAEGQKPSRRNLSSNDNDGGGDSPKSSKPRQSRRHKSAADGTRAAGSDSSLPDVPKKSRRKKSKDFTGDACSRSSRSCRSSSSAAPAATSDPDAAAAAVQEQPSSQNTTNNATSNPRAKDEEEVENC